LGLCKQYDRLTADMKQVILMKVSQKILTAVEMVKPQQAKAKATPTPSPVAATSFSN